MNGLRVKEKAIKWRVQRLRKAREGDELGKCELEGKERRRNVCFLEVSGNAILCIEEILLEILLISNNWKALKEIINRSLTLNDLYHPGEVCAL